MVRFQLWFYHVKSSLRCIVWLVITNIIQWRLIRAQVLKAGISKPQVMRETGFHWETLKKILKNPFPPKFNRKKSRKAKIVN